jgi:hypothetical protein
LPIEPLMSLLQKIGEIAMPLVQKIMRTSQPELVEPQQWIDSDGFTHITPIASAQQPLAEPERWIAEIGRFLDGFRLAAQRDLLQNSNAA